ncbi:MAG: hypothetical protein JO086_00130 [Acidimicrobiia bacterium]|nr:hypothetical protein [Acidimicrobiia bacterium]
MRTHDTTSREPSVQYVCARCCAAFNPNDQRWRGPIEIVVLDHGGPPLDARPVNLAEWSHRCRDLDNGYAGVSPHVGTPKPVVR